MPDSHTPSSHLGLYRSGITGPEHRRFITVGRGALIEDTLEILRSNAGKKPKHHQLFVGPRGMGKTHLLSLVEDEIASDETLSKAYHVARFPEESNRTLSFADFLLGLVEILRDTLPEESDWKELHSRLATEMDDKIIVDTLVPLIRERYRRTKQAVLVMVENLNQIFDEQIKDGRSIAAIRGFFMEGNGCLLLATAPINFDSVNDPKEPFYDFFDTQYLDQLSDEETIELIRRNLEWEKREDILENFRELRPRLLSIYRMTGGSPRLVLMLYELIANEAIMDVKKQFQILLDRITPYYQDRMNDLGPQERAILETMALMRSEPKTPSAIASQTRMPQNKVSSLLGRLAEAKYIRSEANPVDKRSRLYVIREGFFDIWLAMNVSRGERVRLPFLLDFFEGFYPTIEYRDRKRLELRGYLNETEDENGSGVREEDAIETLSYLASVGSAEEQASEKIRLASDLSVRGLSDIASGLIKETQSLELDPMGIWIVERSCSADFPDYLADIEEMIECWETQRTGNLEAFAEKLRQMGNSLTPLSWSEAKIEFLEDHLESMPKGKERIEVQAKLGDFYRKLAKWDKSEHYLRASLVQAEVQEHFLTWILSSLALLLQETNRLEESEPLMRRALAIDEKSYGAEHPKVAIALNNLVHLLLETNRMEESEPLMRRALAIDEKSYGAEHPDVARDLNNLAQLLKATNRVEESEPLMRRVVEVFEKSYGKEHPQVATALNNLAQLLLATNRMEESEPLMRRALAIDEKSYGAEHPDVARDLNNLAQLLLATNRMEESEPLMRRALAIDEKSYGAEHPDVARDLSNLAQLLKATNRVEESEPLMRRALAIDEASYGAEHPRVAIVLNNLALLLQDTNRVEESAPLMHRAVGIFFNFTAQTTHPHPHLFPMLRNYFALLGKMNIETREIIERIIKIGIQSGLSEQTVLSLLKEALGDAK